MNDVKKFTRYRREINKYLNKQGPLDKQQRREAGSFVDQDQQYF